MTFALNKLINCLINSVTNQSKYLVFLVTATIVFTCAPLIAQAAQTQPHITEKQARALKMLSQEPKIRVIKTLRLTITKLSDSQGQVYLGALVNRAELQPYLSQLQTILAENFDDYRANQAARDHQLFHLTLINPIEYQHVDKQLVEQLISSESNINFSSQLQVQLHGLGKAEKTGKSTYFIVAQSQDAQLIRQRFLLGQKDFHITLAFNPSDIYDVRKDISTLIKP